MSSLSPSAVRALVRRARRLALRSPGRTLWTGLLVVIAVAAAVGALSVAWGRGAREADPARAFGTADAVYVAPSVAVADDAAVTEAVASALPDGSTMTGEQVVRDLVVHASNGGVEGSVASVTARLADWSDPLLSGVLEPIEGRPPRDGGVVLSPQLSEATGIGVGDRLTILGSDRALDVVGIASMGNRGADEVAMVPGQLVAGAAAGADSRSEWRFHVDVPAGGSVPAQVDVPGVATGTNRTSAAGEPVDTLEGVSRPGAASADGMDADGRGMIDSSATDRLWAWLATSVALAVMGVGVLAGSAFGIGSARRARANGLLAANGADRSQMAAATAAEAVVVAVPSAVIGVAASWLLRGLWVRFKLPGWPMVIDAAMPWEWTLVTVVAAVVAAVVGAVLFSRSARSRTTAALLDGRMDVVAGRPRASLGWAGWVLVVMFGWGGLNALMGVTGVWSPGVGGSLGAVVAGAVVALWVLCALGAMGVARLALRRGPIGGLVERDLRRRRVGSTAAIIVVATWVFVAISGTATDWFTSSTTSDDRAAPSTVEGGPVSDPASFPTTLLGTTTVVEPPTSSDPAVPAGSGDPLAPTGTETGDPGLANTVLVHRTDAVVSTGGSGSWVVRGSEGAKPPPEPSERDEPDWSRTREQLERAGITAQSATVGRYTGPCPVCPTGFTPTVLVLSSARDIGLPVSTVALLEAGNAVTPFSVGGIESQTVAGVPVRVGAVPPGVQAVMLSSAAPEGVALADPRPALVAEAPAAVDPDVVDPVLDELHRSGLTLESNDPAFQDWTFRMETGAVPSAPGRGLWLWLVVLVGVTLAATAAHRREHGESARVLDLLGADPRSGRRLASATAGTLAGVGVVMGLTAAAVVLALVGARRDTAEPFDGLWNLEATWLLVASLAIPPVVALLARLMPRARSRYGPDGPIPA